METHLGLELLQLLGLALAGVLVCTSVQSDMHHTTGGSVPSWAFSFLLCGS